MRKTKLVRVLHTSDIHLGAPHLGESGVASASVFNDRARHALRRLVEASSQADIDLIIIAGDLFDSNRVDAETIEFTFRQLDATRIPVVILPGNHDCLVPGCVYSQVLSRLSSNVHVLTVAEGETMSFPELDLCVWGKPITSYTDDVRPMKDVPSRGMERWHIAVAHGFYNDAQQSQVYGLQIDEGEILESGQDYVALGHSPSFRCISDGPVKAYYSGSASEANTAAIVDLSEDDGVHVRCYLLH